MARPKLSALSTAGRPRGNGGGRRSGQGANTALDEMLRRQAQNPRPGPLNAPPTGREAPRAPTRPQPPRKREA